MSGIETVYRVGSKNDVTPVFIPPYRESAVDLICGQCGYPEIRRDALAWNSAPGWH